MVSNPGGDEIFRTCPDRPWDPPSLLYNGYQVFPGVKSGRGVILTPHSLLVPWSWKGRSIPLLPLWAVRPVQSLSACTRVYLALHFIQLYIYNIYIYCVFVGVDNKKWNFMLYKFHIFSSTYPRTLYNIHKYNYMCPQRSGKLIGPTQCNNPEKHTPLKAEKLCNLSVISVNTKIPKNIRRV
jgi:hypothetical protein